MALKIALFSCTIAALITLNQAVIFKRDDFSLSITRTAENVGFFTVILHDPNLMSATPVLFEVFFVDEGRQCHVSLGSWEASGCPGFEPYPRSCRLINHVGVKSQDGKEAVVLGKNKGHFGIIINGNAGDSGKYILRLSLGSNSNDFYAHVKFNKSLPLMPPFSSLKCTEMIPTSEPTTPISTPVPTPPFQEYTVLILPILLTVIILAIIAAGVTIYIHNKRYNSLTNPPEKEGIDNPCMVHNKNFIP